MKLSKQVEIELGERDYLIDYTITLGREGHFGACIAPEHSYPEEDSELEIDKIWADGDIDVTDDVYARGELDMFINLLEQEDSTWDFPELDDEDKPGRRY